MTPKSLTTQSLVLQVANEYIKANPFVLKANTTKSGVRKRGRPTVMTQEVVGILEHAFAYDCTVEVACIYAGISRDTYYAFCKEYPEFSDRITVLRNTPILIARTTVVNALQHDASFAMKYLERKRPQEFSLRATFTHETQPKTHDIAPEQKKAVDNIFVLFEKKAREIAPMVTVSEPASKS